MADLTQFSDADLQAMKAGNIAQLSDAGLKILKESQDKPIESTPGPLLRGLDYGSGLVRTVVGNSTPFRALDYAASLIDGKYPPSFKDQLAKAIMGEAPSMAEPFTRHGAPPALAGLAGLIGDTVLSPGGSEALARLSGMKLPTSKLANAGMILADPIGTLGNRASTKAGELAYQSAFAPADVATAGVRGALPTSQVAADNGVTAMTQGGLVQKLQDLLSKNTADRSAAVSNLPADLTTPAAQVLGPVWAKIDAASKKMGYDVSAEMTRAQVQADVKRILAKPDLTAADLQELASLGGKTGEASGAYTVGDTPGANVKANRQKEVMQDAYGEMSQQGNNGLEKLLEQNKPGSGKEYRAQGKESQSLMKGIPPMAEAAASGGKTGMLSRSVGPSLGLLAGGGTYAATRNPELAALAALLAGGMNTTAAKTIGGMALQKIPLGSILKTGVQAQNPWSLLPSINLQNQEGQ